MTIAKIVFFHETAPFCNFFLLKPHFSLPLQPEIVRLNGVKQKTRDFETRDARLLAPRLVSRSPEVPKSKKL